MNQRSPSVLRIALVADELTRACLESSCEVRHLTPLNYRWMLRFWRPDLVLVESAWKGMRNAWQYRVAAYPAHPKRNNQSLVGLVDLARDRDIPTVFWNKEDGVHFDRFIDSARLFDHVLTVDESCIPRYKEVVAPWATVGTLMFAVQPKFHRFTGFAFKQFNANFVGSYSRHVHERRRYWQDLFFGAAVEAGLGLCVYDRNSGRKSANYRYPELPGMEVHSAVSHGMTGAIYKENLVSLNVNTVEDSPTMFSRRLVEILACGGIAVTNRTAAVDKMFSDYCHVLESSEQGVELFRRLRHGPSSTDLARAEAGAEYVLANHTWVQRLADIARVAGI
ncbi:glycosyltransferase [Cupriavidus necator]|uniref:CgeB family protein n=1 Tax=Cupriavidus necator TaxID=106590 RepID=UPI0039C06515